MSKKSFNVLMFTPENAAIRVKRGGVADVPPQLAATLKRLFGFKVAIVSPSYGNANVIMGSRKVREFLFPFEGKMYLGSLLCVNEPDDKRPADLILDCELFKSRAGIVYVNDPAGRPFETDARFFAIVSAMMAACIEQGAFEEFLPTIDVVHAHDWPTAPLLVLKRYHPWFKKLCNIRVVFTIHNIAYQGVRPFDEGQESSLRRFFPELNIDWNTVSNTVLADKRWPNCFNLMGMAIRSADAINTVSKAYADEACRPSDPGEFFFGGEGLEDDLVEAKRQGRFTGILNGCDYGPDYPSAKASLATNLDKLLSATRRWSAEAPHPAHLLAGDRLAVLRSAAEPTIIVTSVTRTADQKVALLLRQDENGRTPLDDALETLARVGGVYVFLGCGDEANDDSLYAIASHHPNFIFLKGFSDACAAVLYSFGDLFFMPSAFEPCGLTQMLAMREGQPCLVNRTGGLADTVIDNHNGFAFSGPALGERVAAMKTRFAEVVQMKISQPEKWSTIKAEAAAARFEWADSAESYIRNLYSV